MWEGRLEWTRKRRTERISAGLCITCGKTEVAAGVRKCEPCAEPYREKNREYDRRRRERADNAGLCRICIRQPRRDGMVTCAECVNRKGTYKRLVWRERVATGLCGRCGAERDTENRVSCRTCLDSFNSYLQAMPEEKKRIYRNNQVRWANENPINVRENKRLYRDRLRKETIAAYGGVCACCGEADWRFLTIDHPKNDGASHRRSLFSNSQNAAKIAGVNFYAKMRQQGYPPGLQVLCWNCNLGRAQFGGICPHQQPLTPSSQVSLVVSSPLEA